MKFEYDVETDEFVAAKIPEENGNRVTVTMEDELGPRFHVEIADFGHVLAALNRLVLRFTPTFVFPERKMNSYWVIPQGQEAIGFQRFGYTLAAVQATYPDCEVMEHTEVDPQTEDFPPLDRF